MKKIIALVLALTMLAAMVVGCGKQEEQEQTVPTTTAPVEEPTTEAIPEDTTPAAPEQAPTSTGALAVLDKIWAVTSENEKFPAAGGDAGNI